MVSLPEAEPETAREITLWLTTFAGFVRAVDYASARPMVHPDVLAFGTHNDIVSGIEPWVATQWNEVWPRTADFSFAIEQTRILASPDGRMAVALAPWTSTGFHPDGSTFARPGRATIVFARSQQGGADRWLCVHSHMSLNRGVPQRSHGNRPVTAW